MDFNNIIGYTGLTLILMFFFFMSYKGFDREDARRLTFLIFYSIFLFILSVGVGVYLGENYQKNEFKKQMKIDPAGELYI